MTNDLNSLREDKKKVGEGCKKFIRYSMEDDSIFCGVEFTYYEDEIDDPDLTPHRATELCDKCKIESQALAKGISVATKLIEEEIHYLETFAEYLILGYPIDKNGDATKIDVRNRIKYLKGLLENSNG